jgi:hypothetical protein
MPNKVYQYYKDLPSWAKGVSVVGLLFVGYIVGRKIYKVVFPSPDEAKNRQLFNQIDNEIKANENAGLRPTFQESNYQTFANTIYNSMRYAIGDDYAAVERTLKLMKNNLDVNKLIKAFGTRQDYVFGIDAGKPMDLLTYVRKELGNDYGGLTDYRVQRINADWKTKGISYII